MKLFIPDTHPHLLQELDLERHSLEELSDVTPGSNKIFNWVCTKGHKWEAPVKSRASKNANCPFCSGNKFQAGYNDLQTTHPDLAKEWDQAKNFPMLANAVMATSAVSVWWICPSGHNWSSTVVNRSRHGKQCTICFARKKPIVSKTRPKSSFADKYPELVHYWDNEANSIHLSEVPLNPDLRYFWTCEFGHTWINRMATFLKNKTNPCPFCNGSKPIPGVNDAGTLNPRLLLEWHPTKNTVPLNELSPGSKERVWWHCAEGHEWNTYLYSRTSSVPSQCPECSVSKGTSYGESELLHYLQEELHLRVEHGNRSILKGQELDLFIPELSFAIEFNGIYWHTEEQGKHRYYHQDKWDKCRDQGIQLIQIWEDDWSKNAALIKAMISRKLNLSSSVVVYARKTKLHTLTTADARLFFEQNHLQGFAAGSYYLGLKDNDITVAAIALKKEQNGDVLNIVRYATSVDVPGGFTKLLRQAEKLYSPSAFITFADHTVSDGGLYENNGFEVEKELKPDYSYVVNKKRVHKFNYRLKRFKNDSQLIWLEGLSEKQLATLNGISRIWDAGKTKYRLNVKKKDA